MRKKLALLALAVALAAGSVFVNAKPAAALVCPPGSHPIICPSHSFCCPDTALCVCG